MKNLVLISFLLLAVSVQAQLFDSISVGNINARIWSDGIFFWDKVGNPKFEYPKGSGKHINSASSIWIGGLDNGGQLRLAAQDYNLSGNDFWAGPIITPGSGTYNAPAYIQKYNRVWKVSKAEIDNHIANYQSGSYTAPTSILDWPGNGNVANGEPAQIAPYFDANNDQIYNPMNGDYPLIKGDEAIFSVFNDAAGLHTQTGAEPIGVEIRALFYGFNDIDTLLSSTLFASFSVITGVSPGHLDQAYMGIFDDFDLGYYKDDFMGCDSALQLFYAYNGDNDDSGNNGYGTNPPATGVTFLNQPLNQFLTYNNSLDTINGNPVTQVQYYNYLRGIWKDGTPMVNNGFNGTLAAGAGATCDYLYPGFPESQQGWTEFSAGNQADDRRGLGSSYLNVLLAGYPICIDVAWVSARGNGNNLSSVAELRLATQAMRNYYNTHNLGCAAYTTVATQNIISSQNISISPNPLSSNILNIKGLNHGNSLISIWNTSGQCVYKQAFSPMNEFEMNIPTSITNGLYWVKIENDNYYFSQKLVVIRN